MPCQALISAWSVADQSRSGLILLIRVLGKGAKRKAVVRTCLVPTGISCVMFWHERVRTERNLSLTKLEAHANNTHRRTRPTWRLLWCLLWYGQILLGNSIFFMNLMDDHSALIGASEARQCTDCRIIPELWVLCTLFLGMLGMLTGPNLQFYCIPEVQQDPPVSD